MIPHYVAPITIENDDLDPYSQRGIVLSRDTASRIWGALDRDAFAMEQRGGEANLAGALEQRMIARAIVSALNKS